MIEEFTVGDVVGDGVRFFLRFEFFEGLADVETRVKVGLRLHFLKG